MMKCAINKIETSVIGSSVKLWSKNLKKRKFSDSTEQKTDKAQENTCFFFIFLTNFYHQASCLTLSPKHTSAQNLETTDIQQNLYTFFSHSYATNKVFAKTLRRNKSAKPPSSSRDSQVARQSGRCGGIPSYYGGRSVRTMRLQAPKYCRFTRSHVDRIGSFPA